MDWTTRLKFRDLRVLLTMYETCNLSKTAERMALTQPALSKWLRELEAQMGHPLFLRHSRGLVPTATCEMLVTRSHLMLNALDRTTDLLDVVASGAQGKLYIGCTPAALTDLLPAAIADMYRQFPNVSIAVSDGILDQLLPQLRSGRLDLLVSALEDRDLGGDLAQARLHKERMVVVAGPDHPLQGKRNVTWEMVLSYPWIAPPPDSFLFRELQLELALANQPLPRFMGEVSSNLLIAGILKRTDTLAFFTSRSARFFQDSGHVRSIRVPIQRSTHIGVCWRKGTPLGVLETAFFQALVKAGSARWPPLRKGRQHPP